MGTGKLSPSSSVMIWLNSLFIFFLFFFHMNIDNVYIRVPSTFFFIGKKNEKSPHQGSSSWCDWLIYNDADIQKREKDRSLWSVSWYKKNLENIVESQHHGECMSIKWTIKINNKNLFNMCVWPRNLWSWWWWWDVGCLNSSFQFVCVVVVVF